MLSILGRLSQAQLLLLQLSLLICSRRPLALPSQQQIYQVWPSWQHQLRLLLPWPWHLPWPSQLPFEHLQHLPLLFLQLLVALKMLGPLKSYRRDRPCAEPSPWCFQILQNRLCLLLPLQVWPLFASIWTFSRLEQQITQQVLSVERSRISQ